MSEQYDLLKMRIDICAGRSDGIIPPANITMHHAAMVAGGCDVHLEEFDCGHLDFTASGAAASTSLLSQLHMHDEACG